MDRREFLSAMAVTALGGWAVAGCSAMNQSNSNTSPGSTAAGGGGGGGRPFKVGVYAPLTGELAENGQNFKRSFELFAEQVNAKGGINGEQLELVFRDDKGEPKTATNIAQEYAQDDTIDACLGSFSSTASMAAAPVLVKAGIPNISPTSSHPDYTSLGRGLYRGTDTQKVEAKFVADFMAKKNGKLKDAIVYRQDDWGISASKNFEDGAKEAGATIVAKQAVAPETRDFRTILTSLRGANPDGIFVALQYSDAAVMAQQMAEAGWAPFVATSTSLYTQKMIELGGKGSEGWYVSTFFFAQSEKPNVKEFVTAYKAKHGKDPDAFSAVAWDSINVLAEARKTLNKEHGADGRKKLTDAIYKTTFEGVTGKMEFDEKGDVNKPISWLQIKGGKFVEAS